MASSSSSVAAAPTPASATAAEAVAETESALRYFRRRRHMKISVMVPAVRSCSGSIMRRLVMIVMLMLRFRAERMAGRSGGEVRLGVRMVMDCVALWRRWRMKTFRGVGGGVVGREERKGRMGKGRANRWWGEGRRIVDIIERVEGRLDE